MEMSDTNSSHSDWVQFYQSAISGEPPGGGGGGVALGRVSPAAESTVVTTTSASTTGASGGAHSNIEGRVGKSARRRSRASRKAPTTLFNTDTANFRAMVQQFTGGVPSSAPFQSGYHRTGAADGGGGPATLSFGFGVNQLLHQSMAHPFGVQQQQQQQRYHHQHQQRYHHHHQQSNNRVINSSNSDHVFLQGFGNPARGSMEISDGFLLEGISSSSSQSQLIMPWPATSAESRTTEGFLL